MYQVVRMFLTPYLLLFFRTRCIDSDKVPLEGPAIIAPNHFSFMDHFFIAVYMRRKVQFMAKSQLFKRPLAVHLHARRRLPDPARPPRRGGPDQTARTILGRGNMIVMYAEGGRSRTEKLGEPKPGIGKLALETGAPVVPSAIAGLGEGAQLEEAPVPQGHRPVRRPDPLREGREPDARAGAGRVRRDLRGDREGLLRASAVGPQERGPGRARRAPRRRRAPPRASPQRPTTS